MQIVKCPRWLRRDWLLSTNVCVVDTPRGPHPRFVVRWSDGRVSDINFGEFEVILGATFRGLSCLGLRITLLIAFNLSALCNVSTFLIKYILRVYPRQIKTEASAKPGLLIPEMSFWLRSSDHQFRRKERVFTPHHPAQSTKALEFGGKSHVCDLKNLGGEIFDAFRVSRTPRHSIVDHWYTILWL
jgi:hypothetical protein